MQSWAEHLRTRGVVRLFDYSYMRAGSRRPDPLPQLIAAHRAAFLEARESHAGPVVLIGKSMGGRIGCHVALVEEVAAVICLGFPLCAGGDPAKMRDKVLRELAQPILFVQGTRDSLCPLDLLENVRREMRAPNELKIVAGGDHSLLVRKMDLRANNQTQDEINAQILAAIGDFMREKRILPNVA